MPACRAAPSCDEYMNIVLQEMQEKEKISKIFFFFKKFLFPDILLLADVC